jgi:hypothetical protein
MQSLTRNSFLAIALGPRFYARTSPLVIPVLDFYFALDLYAAYWFTLSTTRWSRPALRSAAQPKIGACLASSLRRPSWGGRRCNVRPWRGLGRRSRRADSVSPFMPCQLVACRLHVSLGTFLYFYQTTPPAHYITD